MGKLKQNEHGFSTVEVILILVVLCLVGFVGWYVWHSRGTTTNSSVPTSTKPSQKSTTNTSASETDMYVGWKTYEGDGFTIKYPDSWKIKLPPGEMTYDIELTSPDYIATEGGYGGTKSGSMVGITPGIKTDITVDQVINQSYDKVLPPKSAKTEVKEHKINSIKAAEYKVIPYEGPQALQTQFDKGDKSYFLTLEEATDRSDFNENVSIYRNIVKSFKFTTN